MKKMRNISKKNWKQIKKLLKIKNWKKNYLRLSRLYQLYICHIYSDTTLFLVKSKMAAVCHFPFIENGRKWKVFTWIFREKSLSKSVKNYSSYTKKFRRSFYERVCWSISTPSNISLENINEPNSISFFFLKGMIITFYEVQYSTIEYYLSHCFEEIVDYSRKSLASLEKTTFSAPSLRVFVRFW